MNPVRVTLSIKENNHRITLGFSEQIISGGGGGELPWYDGSYTVIPSKTGQTLPTANRSMRSNVTIADIPYSEVSNPSGGLTVSIAQT